MIPSEISAHRLADLLPIALSSCSITESSGIIVSNQKGALLGSCASKICDASAMSFGISINYDERDDHCVGHRQLRPYSSFSPYDVILAEITSGLNFDQFERNLAGIG